MTTTGIFFKLAQLAEACYAKFDEYQTPNDALTNKDNGGTLSSTQADVLLNSWQLVAGRVGKRVLVCPPNTTIAAPILRGQTIKPFAHPTGLHSTTSRNSSSQSDEKNVRRNLECGDSMEIPSRCAFRNPVGSDVSSITTGITGYEGRFSSNDVVCG